MSEPYGLEEMGSLDAPTSDACCLGCEAETITFGELRFLFFFVSVEIDKALAIFKTGANKCQAMVFLTPGVGAVAEIHLWLVFQILSKL